MDKDSDQPNVVYSGMGREVYPVVRDMIEMSHDTDVCCFDEALGREQ